MTSKQHSRATLTRPVLTLIVVALSAALAATGCSYDTNKGGMGGGPGRPGDGMHPALPSVQEIISKLDLEPDQRPLVRSVLVEAEDERASILGAARPGDGDRPDEETMSQVRVKLDDLDTRTEEQLAELLTDDQMARYREIMQEAFTQRERMSRMGPGQRSPGERPAAGW